MPTRFPTLGFNVGEQAAANLQARANLQEARSQVIANFEKIYRDVELYPSANIPHTSYGVLAIDCRPLKLDEDGKHLEIPASNPSASDPSSPIFFKLQGAAWVPDVCETNPEVTADLREITDEWENAKNVPLLRGLHSQVWYVFLGLERMFFQFRREFDLQGDRESLLNLREVSKWVKSGSIVPSVIAERFYPAIWGSIRCSPAATFVPKKLLYPTGTPPHTMIHILIEQEPSKTLTRAGVMAITIFGQMKARVIEAHCTPQVLVIKKTDLLDFSTKSQARIWTFCLDSCVPTSSKMIEPTVPTKTPKVCNIDIVDLGKVPDGSW
ncbi:hypothetical protein N7501_010175 [Penicillium viridicatum]|nr:hypothetical protein N7501_010175 [Penicillium viridicatum]